MAEVLITLTIIGVIAALTVPNLINKVQDHGYRSAFFKIFNVIKNAEIQAIRDGVPFYDDKICLVTMTYRSNPELFRNYFKIREDVYTYGVAESTTGKRLNVFEKFYGSNFRDNIKALNGLPFHNYGFSDHILQIAIQLVDSSLIIFSTYTGVCSPIWIDVNGGAKPNTIGRDIFILNGYGASLGDGIRPLYTSTERHQCNYASSGFACAHEIFKDKSYKIPKE